MKFYERKVKYFKFFEDSKIFEIDNTYERLAIVFFGKENLIHIFDAKRYIDYLPLKYESDLLQDVKSDENFNKDEKTNTFISNNFQEKEYNLNNQKSRQENTNKSNLNIQTNESILFFENIKNQKEREAFELFNNLTFLDKDELGITLHTQNQEYIIFNKLENVKNLSMKNKKKISYIPEQQDYEISQQILENFNINNLNDHSDQQNLNLPKIKFKLKKPKLKSSLLSVIGSPSNNIMGLKWFDISIIDSNSNNSNNKNLILNSELEKLSKLLLSVNDDGNIVIYSMTFADYSIPVQVDLQELQNMPFLSYPEQWRAISQVHTGKPIRDFYLSQKGNKIYSLHLDNYIMVWIISYVGLKLTILASYAINITPNLLVNKILVDKKENFIYTFHNECFSIFKIMPKPPFPMLFSYKYEKDELHEKTTSPSRKKLVAQNGKYIEKNSYFFREENCNLYSVNTNSNDIQTDIYEIHYNDLIDRSENLKIQDINFFNAVQKPEFSLQEEYLLVPYFNYHLDKYFLVSFKNKFFTSKIFGDFNFFNESVAGLRKDLVNIIKSSGEPINFSLSPSYYFKKFTPYQDEQEEIYKKVNEDSKCRRRVEEILEEEFTNEDILTNFYQPTLVINKGEIYFFNLTKLNENDTLRMNSCENSSDYLLVNYSLEKYKLINNEYLISVWTNNNTILLSSSRIFMCLLKFFDEKEVLGVPINSQKLEEISN
jgi:hypothetical protein